MTLRKLFAATAALAVSASLCSADQLDVTLANGNFIAGSTIPTNNFTTTNSADGAQVGLKVRNRFANGGQPNAIVGNTYFVNPGLAQGSTNRFAFQFDFQFSPAAGSDASAFDDFALRVSFDDDPTAGTRFSSATSSINSVDSSGDGRINNPGGGAWNTDAVPFVFANSFQPQFIPGVVFAGLPGEYNVRFEVLDAGGGTFLSQEVVGVVVPSPSAALGGLGLFAVTLLRRRTV